MEIQKSYKLVLKRMNGSDEYTFPHKPVIGNNGVGGSFLTIRPRLVGDPEPGVISQLLEIGIPSTAITGYTLEETITRTTPPKPKVTRILPPLPDWLVENCQECGGRPAPHGGKECEHSALRSTIQAMGRVLDRADQHNKAMEDDDE